MQTKVAAEGEQSRPMPELKHSVEVELLAHFFRELKFVVANEEGLAHPAVGCLHLNEAGTTPLGVGYPVQRLK